jgi:hypothetical protein
MGVTFYNCFIPPFIIHLKGGTGWLISSALRQRLQMGEYIH